VTVRLYFPHHPGSTTPQPSEQEMELYAQHQRDMQRVAATHGIGSLPWPQTAYTGNTAFALIFPERLALNRALVFLVHAEPKALLRYAQALQLVTQGLTPLVT